jgi:hypothetical protein
LGSRGSGPVFVDPTGRRRRLVTVAGAAVGLGLLSALALLVAGLLGASPVPLPGLPQGGQGAQQAVVPAEAPPSADPVDPTTSRPAQAPAGAPASAPAGRTATTPTPASSSPSPCRPPRGNRPTECPGNPHPGRSK